MSKFAIPGPDGRALRPATQRFRVFIKSVFRLVPIPAAPDLSPATCLLTDIGAGTTTRPRSMMTSGGSVDLAMTESPFTAEDVACRCGPRCRRDNRKPVQFRLVELATCKAEGNMVTARRRPVRADQFSSGCTSSPAHCAAQRPTTKNVGAAEG